MRFERIVVFRERGVLFTILGEVVVGASTSNKPAHPIDGVLVVDGLLGVEQVVQQGDEVLRGLGGLGLGRVALRLRKKKSETNKFGRLTSCS